MARPEGFEPSTPGLEVETSGAAPSSIVSQPLASKRQGVPAGSHRVAPDHPVSHAACYPVVTRSHVPVRVLDGGADHLLTVRQVAERLGVSTATVYKLCDRGELPHVRISNAIRMVPADLAAFVARSRVSDGRGTGAS